MAKKKEFFEELPAEEVVSEEVEVTETPAVEVEVEHPVDPGNKSRAFRG